MNLQKQDLDIFLDEQEQTHLRQFADNPTLVEAVRKLLLFSIYNNGVLKKGEKADPRKNFLLSITNRRGVTDEELGREARAAAEGISALEFGFESINLFKTPIPEPKGSENNAE